MRNNLQYSRARDRSHVTQKSHDQSDPGLCDGGILEDGDTGHKLPMIMQPCPLNVVSPSWKIGNFRNVMSQLTR